jgi:acetolactate synthase-1/2/3 large subunit
MISVATAYKDCSPLIIISGAVRTALKGSDGMLEVDHCRIFAPVCKEVFRIERVEDIPGIFSKAYQIAITPARGPVFIEVPDNIWLESGMVDLQGISIEVPKRHTAPQRDLKKVFALLRESERPILLVGGGLAEEYAGVLQDLVETANLRVITTGNGRGILPEDHSHCLGRAGFSGGNTVADTALAGADVVLALGCTLSDTTTYEFTAKLTGKIVVVNADSRALELLPQSYRTQVQGIIADAGDFLSRLMEMLREDPFRKTDASMDFLNQKREEMAAQVSQGIASEKVPLSAGRVVHTLSELTPENTIFTCGSGFHMLYVNNFLKIRKPKSFLASNNFGAMGFGFPASLAAKIIYPERPVVAVLGDGDFMMTVQDIETGVREGVVATVLILNDNSYRALRYGQKILFAGRVYGTEHRNPDIVKLAASFGATGYVIEKPAEIEPVLREALDCGRLAIVDARIDPDESAPMNLEAILRMRGVQ